MTKTGQHQRCISIMHWLETSCALALGAMFVLAVICTPAAQAQTYIVAHRFKGSPKADGAEPLQGGRLIGDSAGNLYGTTEVGGIGCTAGCGVVFKVDETGETVLYSFTGGADGWQPFAAVSAGNLYGTTQYGGIGYGVVFKLDTTGKETVLHAFTGGADGAYPYLSLSRDSAGNLYGTTPNGGSTTHRLCFQGCGVVFKLDTTGTETVLYTFTGGANGAYPDGVKRDSAGNLYGTTSDGGIDPCTSGCGVVFKLTP